MAAPSLADAQPDDVRARIMTTDEAAAMLRRPKGTLIYWRRVHQGPPYWRQGRVVRYDRDAVLDWLAAEQREGERHHSATSRRRR